jgi:hypothetical protein
VDLTGSWSAAGIGMNKGMDTRSKRMDNRNKGMDDRNEGTWSQSAARIGMRDICHALTSSVSESKQDGNSR